MGVGIEGPTPTGDLMSRVYAGPRRYPAPGTSRDAYQKSHQLPICRTFAIQVQRAAAVASAATAPGRGADPRAAPLPGRGLCGHRDDRYGLPGPRSRYGNRATVSFGHPAGRAGGRRAEGPERSFPWVSGCRRRPLRVEDAHLHGICGRSAQLLHIQPFRDRKPRRPYSEARRSGGLTPHFAPGDAVARPRCPVRTSPNLGIVAPGPPPPPIPAFPRSGSRRRRAACATPGRQKATGIHPCVQPAEPISRGSPTGVQIPLRHGPATGRPHGISSNTPAPPGGGRSATVPDVQSGPHHSSRARWATHRWVADPLASAAAYPFRGGREGRSSIRLMWASFG